MILVHKVIVSELNNTYSIKYSMSGVGFPGGVSGKESACQCRRHKRLWFNPLVRKNPCRRKWQPTPVFLSRKFHGQRSLVGYNGVKKNRTWLSAHTHKYILSIIIMMQYTWKSYLFDILISFSLDLYSEVGLEDYMVFFFLILEKPPYCFP